MGPESDSVRPTRPRFIWDMRTIPWTDGVGCQEEYAQSVELWEDMHDILEVTNHNRIAPKLRGISLKS